MGRVGDSWEDSYGQPYPEEPYEPVQEKPKPYSVSGAMQLAKNALEGVTVRLVGEISEFSNKAGYKAVYFTVKDEKASLPCMMWMSRFRSFDLDLSVGQKVEIAGRFTLYAAKGRMNFDVFSIALAGEGELRMKVARLARKLEAEGLTAQERKKPLPVLPERIGLVTSPRGKVVHDVLRTLRRRYPMAKVLLAGVPVEGATAVPSLIEGIRRVTAAGAEVVLVCRGGGSYEDYMPFNDETLARVIADNPIPIVTAIGHEPDTTIADLVADRRASTPTGAAEIVSPTMEELKAGLEARSLRMHGTLSRRLERSIAYIKRYADRPLMKDPHYLYASEAQFLDAAGDRLHVAFPRTIAAYDLRIDAQAQRLNRALPQSLNANKAAVSTLAQRLQRDGQALVPAFAAQVSMGAARLEDLSPLAVLARGYAIARDDAGRVLKSAQGVSRGDSVSVAVSDGVIDCEVIRTELKE